jgi:non-heme chloroperoxidase
MMKSGGLGTLKCVDAWGTDFRGDMGGLGSVPLLIVQGSEDRILPPPNSGRRLPALVPHAEYHEIDGGPHNIGWTHANQPRDTADQDSWRTEIGWPIFRVSPI